MLMFIREAWRRVIARWRSQLRVVDVVGDEVPPHLEMRQVVRMIDEGHQWLAALVCPCGCGEVIELNLSPAAKPRWRLEVENGRPTLSPSVWRTTGCRSHFWVRQGKVEWVSSPRPHRSG